MKDGGSRELQARSWLGHSEDKSQLKSNARPSGSWSRAKLRKNKIKQHRAIISREMGGLGDEE